MGHCISFCSTRELQVFSLLFVRIPYRNSLLGRQEAVILFLVEDVTYNIGDQKFHEFEVRRQCPDARVVRKTLTEVGKQGHVTQVRMETVKM
jgi:hypothetical protein